MGGSPKENRKTIAGSASRIHHYGVFIYKASFLDEIIMRILVSAEPYIFL